MRSSRFFLVTAAFFLVAGCSTEVKPLNKRSPGDKVNAEGANRSGSASNGSQCKADYALQVPIEPQCPGGRLPNGEFHKGGGLGFNLAATGDIRIDSLSSGSMVEAVNGVITYSFYNQSIYEGRYYGDEQELKEVDDVVKENFREVLRNMQKVLPVKFEEVQETATVVGAIRLMRSKMEGENKVAYAYYPWGTGINNIGSDVFLNEIWYQKNYFHEPAGQNGYLTLIHEVGHALGLKHPFDGPEILPANQQNDAHTVMSYNRPTRHVASTFMLNDLLALNSAYGLRSDHNSPAELKFMQTYRIEGDDSFRANDAKRLTLHYSDAIKKVNLAALPVEASGYSLDLKPGGLLVKTGEGSTPEKDYFGPGTAFSFASKVLEVISSPSSDTLYMNDLANIISGYHPAMASGKDTIYDATAADTIDLSLYYEVNVKKTQEQGNLLLQLRPDSSITINQYNAAEPVQIRYKQVPDVLVSLGNLNLQRGEEDHRVQVSLPLLLSEALQEDARIDYTLTPIAAAPEDKALSSGSLAFKAGETMQTIAMQIERPPTLKADLRYKLVLTAASMLSLSQTSYEVVLAGSELEALFSEPAIVCR